MKKIFIIAVVSFFAAAGLVVAEQAPMPEKKEVKQETTEQQKETNEMDASRAKDSDQQIGQMKLLIPAEEKIR